MRRVVIWAPRKGDLVVGSPADLDRAEIAYLAAHPEWRPRTVPITVAVRIMTRGFTESMRTISRAMRDLSESLRHLTP